MTTAIRLSFVSLLFLLVLAVGCQSSNDSSGARPADDDNDASPAADDDDDDVSPADDDDNDDASPPAARNWFFDEQNRVVIYHGAQIVQESPPFLSWHTAADYDRLVEWGLNSVRFGIVWEAVEPTSGQYDENFLSQLDERIGWLRDRGISAFLEMHQDVYGKKYAGDGAPDWACVDDGIPMIAFKPWYVNYLQPAVIAAFDNFWGNSAGVQDAYIAMWRQLAARYANEPAIAGYDLMNEPFFGTNLPFIVFDRLALTPFYKKLIRAMKSADRKHLYLAEPAGAVGSGVDCWMQNWDIPNVAYAPHLYPFIPNILNYYSGDPREIEVVMESAERTAKAMHTPIWVGEWALFNAAQTVNADQYMIDATRVLDDHLASWSYWIYDKDDNGGLLDSSGNERTWVLDEISRPYPQRTAGFPTRFSFDIDTKHFEFSWDENPRATGATIVYLPERRHYPNGFMIACSDPDGQWSYSWDDAAQLLTLSPNRNIANHTMTIDAK